MRLLLDTHLILWWQGAQKKLPSEARALVENTPDPVYVSRASLWEITIKAGLGKIRVDLPRFCERVTADGFIWLPIENAHILQLAELPQCADHKDPFDRLLVAQSQSEPLTLLTVDPKLERYGNTVRVL